MERLYSAAEAARILATSRRTVVRRCASASIGRQLGKGKGAAWILTRDEIDQLRSIVQEGPGNPGFRTNQVSKGGQKRRVSTGK